MICCNNGNSPFVRELTAELFLKHFDVTKAATKSTSPYGTLLSGVVAVAKEQGKTGALSNIQEILMVLKLHKLPHRAI